MSASPEPVRLHRGDPAPQFAAVDHSGRSWTLSNLKGSKVWLWFYPGPFGNNCTKQACGYRDRHDRFAAKNIQVFGLNDKDAETNGAWVEQEGLPFSILLDPDRAIGEAYGFCKPGTDWYLLNLDGGRRPAVVIDEQGLILDVFPDLMTDEDQEAALRSLED